MRGYASIGLCEPKCAQNIGGTIRAAMAYGAAGVSISGDRFKPSWLKHPTNTIKGHRHIPVLSGELALLRPLGSVAVAVEICEGAEDLIDFKHPTSAFYIFGPEDGSISDDILSWCDRKIKIPTAFCMNLAACVNVVLYDRLAKQIGGAQ